MDETKKYIIEFSEDPHTIRLLKLKNGDKYPVTEFKTVTPYTEPDLEQVREEAYEEGRNSLLIEVQKAGKNKIKLEEDEYYQRGLSDAWEAARKIIDMPEADLLNLFTECYAAVCTSVQVFLKYDASECIEKIRQYEQEKGEQIQVGDEVENTQTGVKFIVTHIWFNNHGEKGISGFNHNCSAFSATIELVKKTGRHFPEIAEVLQKMKEADNG